MMLVYVGGLVLLFFRVFAIARFAFCWVSVCFVLLWCVSHIVCHVCVLFVFVCCFWLCCVGVVALCCVLLHALLFGSAVALCVCVLCFVGRVCLNRCCLCSARVAVLCLCVWLVPLLVVTV